MISANEARAIARDVYIYGFPLVDSYRIQYSYFVDRSGPEFKAPWNALSNTARVYTPDDKALQTPNSDTPYSFLGADLRAEPLVLTVPAIGRERYYSLQFIDMYTFNFAYVGSRATGTDAGSFLLAGPNWKGDTPPGIKAVIRSETEFAFVLYRTQLFSPADIDNVRKIQAGYTVASLSQFLGTPAPPAPPIVTFIKPLSAEDEKSSPAFFDILNFILQFCPVHPSETNIMARFAPLGLGADGMFDSKALSSEMREAVQAGITDAWNSFKEFKETQINTGIQASADSFGTRAVLNGRYLVRMSAAILGIYGNSKDEAIYPVYFVDDGKKPLSGTNRYKLRFATNQLPPVNAFWSLTLYELPSSLLSANKLNRYLINSSMLPDLRRDADRGITLYVQHESPGKDRETNWLPAPNGPFFAVLRLYWPKPEALDDGWKAPALRLVDGKIQSPAGIQVADAIAVTADNFIRAESDIYLAALVKEGGLGKFNHRRELAAMNNQTVIRLNRDTLYSSAIFDLDAGPVTVTLPDAGKRFMSMQVINQDHYVPAVIYDAGSYSFDKEKVGTRYAAFAIRTLVDPADSKDLQQVHALQDAITVKQAGSGSFEIPNWDMASQKKVRDALLVLGATLSDFKKAFGTRDNIDPVRHLIATAAAWGGNPDKDATYLNITPRKNDGTTIYRLDVRDVPVDGFWSVSVYDAEGYYRPNKLNAYTLNNITAQRADDGSIAIQFGGCDGKLANCLPIVPGWNYTVRLYRPRAAILDGTWNFPELQPVG
jgi:hypothetical protein